MKLIKNKLGGEKILSIWWFFVLAAVTIGISSGVVIFYGASYDVRIKEAEILHEKLLDCLIKDNGFLNEKILQEDFDLFSECGLKKDSFEKSPNFFFKLEFFDDSSNSFIEPILKGDYSMESNCPISGSLKAEGYPKCFSGKEFFLYSKNGLVSYGTLNILTASNNQGENFQDAA